MSGAGGVCVHLNAWFVSVLKSLGFQAHISAGNYFAYIPSPEGTHCIGILQLQGKVYGVDVGCSNPIDEPIPLHQLPYTRRAGGVRYEYRYNADGDWYERWQLDGTILGEKFVRCVHIYLYQEILSLKNYWLNNKLSICTKFTRRMKTRHSYVIDLQQGQNQSPILKRTLSPFLQMQKTQNSSETCYYSELCLPHSTVKRGTLAARVVNLW